MRAEPALDTAAWCGAGGLSPAPRMRPPGESVPNTISQILDNPGSGEKPHRYIQNVVVHWR